MRNNRLKNINTLYLLGAGASYALTLPPRGSASLKTTPLDFDFNKRIKNHKSNKNWVKESIEYHIKNWVGSESLIDLGLEEAILKRAGNYDLLNAVHKVKLNRNRYSDAKCENQDYINNLSHLITEVLHGCKQNTQSLATTFANSLFKLRTRKVNGKRKRVCPTNRVITFNYDTILDREILHLGHLNEYSMYFDRIGNNLTTAENALTRRPATEPFPYLIKLHGSTNWRVTETDYKSIVSGASNSRTRVPIWFDWKKTPSVTQAISPLIVPPLPNKPITTSSIFAHLWQCAFEYLHESRRLVIVGYSCPQTDSFAMSLLSNVRDSKLKEIIVVDPEIYSLSKYKKLLVGATTNTVKWIYYDNFYEYIQANS